MTNLDFPALRQALEAGELTRQQIAELLTAAEEQATMIAALEKRAQMATTWARAHYNGKKKAEKALLESVKRVARDSAALARRWPKHELAKMVVGGKPTKDQQYIARVTANNIAQHILNQVEEA